MKIDHDQPSINLALGMTTEKYQEHAADIQETIIKGLLDHEKVRCTQVLENKIKELRKEHLNTNVEPSSYELEMVVLGYLFGRILSPDHLKSLETAAIMKKFSDNL